MYINHFDLELCLELYSTMKILNSSVVHLFNPHDSEDWMHNELL